MGGAEQPQGSGRQQQPDNLLPWQWPASKASGQRSSNTSDGSSQGTQNPSEWLIGRSVLATAVVSAAPTIVSLLVAFGCHLSNEQQLAIPAAVAAVTAIVLATRARRGR